MNCSSPGEPNRLFWSSALPLQKNRTFVLLQCMLELSSTEQGSGNARLFVKTQPRFRVPKTAVCSIISVFDFSLGLFDTPLGGKLEPLRAAPPPSGQAQLTATLPQPRPSRPPLHSSPPKPDQLPAHPPNSLTPPPVGDEDTGPRCLCCGTNA
jgi:hypothetical protein